MCAILRRNVPVSDAINRGALSPFELCAAPAGSLLTLLQVSQRKAYAKETKCRTLLVDPLWRYQTSSSAQSANPRNQFTSKSKPVVPTNQCPPLYDLSRVAISGNPLDAALMS